MFFSIANAQSPLTGSMSTTAPERLGENIWNYLKPQCNHTDRTFAFVVRNVVRNILFSGTGFSYAFPLAGERLRIILFLYSVFKGIQYFQNIRILFIITL